MRPKIYDNIFQYAKKYIEKNSIYSPKVYKSAPTESKTFPLVIIPECKIVIADETLKYGEQKYNLIFDIETYTTDKTIENKKIARQTIISELQKLIYDVFEEHYKMLGEEPQLRPNADLNVAREGIKFTAKIKNNIIYRR